MEGKCQFQTGSRAITNFDSLGAHQPKDKQVGWLEGTSLTPGTITQNVDKNHQTAPFSLLLPGLLGLCTDN